MPTIIEQIRNKQSRALPQLVPLVKQDPEMLYIGCVDARLDPVDDIGIEQGRALIYRNIGALVPKSQKSIPGVVTASDSMGGVLELFLDLMEREPPASRAFKKKHIVVSGHTHCGGINACACCAAKSGGFLERYLKPLTEFFGVKPKEELRELEKKSVRESVENLRSYDIVRQAEEKGLVELHGWIIDTATKSISEMDEEGKFMPMSTLGRDRGERSRTK